MSEGVLVVVIPQADGSEQRVRLGMAWQHGEDWSVWLDPTLVKRRPSLKSGGFNADPRIADLEYLAARAKRTLEDPRRSKWHEEARNQLLQIEAEIQRVQGRPPPQALAPPAPR